MSLKYVVSVNLGNFFILKTVDIHQVTASQQRDRALPTDVVVNTVTGSIMTATTKMIINIQCNYFYYFLYYETYLINYRSVYTFPVTKQASQLSASLDMATRSPVRMKGRLQR